MWFGDCVFVWIFVVEWLIGCECDGRERPLSRERGRSFEGGE